MCGIVGISSAHPVADRLVEGLRRLEYRGYDSAGLAVTANGHIERRRAAGKIAKLDERLRSDPVDGRTGIAHTRWATHGKPTETNAHPHLAGRCAIVHNGIIENYRDLRAALQESGRVFESETDSEVIAQLIDSELGNARSPEEAFSRALAQLDGAFAIAAVFSGEDGLILGARKGSPLVVGHGEDETFLGSDAIALAPFTSRITYLKEGDWVVIRGGEARFHDEHGDEVERSAVQSSATAAMVGLGEYQHFMLKEIHEQPESIARSLGPYLDGETGGLRLDGETTAMLAEADRAVAVACGTAHYASAVAKYWFERLARLPLECDIASEYRYRSPVLPRTGPALFVSQSGETADTLAALRHCKEAGAPTLGVVNVPESSIAREADHLAPTYAGPEIGVASTKAFTAQLTVLAVLAVAAAKARREINDAEEREAAAALLGMPRQVSKALEHAPDIQNVARTLSKAETILFIGRGAFHPLAMEGALKLKEVSYIHAEGYAAGELKHGPIALIEEGVPVIVIAPKDELFEKTISSMEEVKARGAHIFLITDAAGAAAAGASADEVLLLPEADPLVMPVLAAIPVQLLAYYVATAKGTDVDQPRNLAKSVTVE